MSGPVFALLSALSYAFNSIFLRRAVIRVSDATIGTLISVPMAVPFMIVVLVLTGQLGSIFEVSWQSYLWLSLAGILHYVIGRALYYSGVQLVGANVTGILWRVNAPVTVILGISLLGEPFSWQLATGVLLIVIGITAAGLNPQMFHRGKGPFSGIPPKAFVFAFGAGVSWGITPILVKIGLQGVGSPAAGVFISFLAASLVLSTSLLRRGRRTSLAGMTGRTAGLFFGAGLCSCIANLMRYIALSLAPASVVSPLNSIAPIFLLALSYLFNRELEIFSKPVIVGVIAVVIGSILLV